MTSETVNLACTRCNSTQFRYPSGRELQPNDTITCAGCGGQITVGEARKQGIEAAKKLIADQFRGMFKSR